MAGLVITVPSETVHELEKLDVPGKRNSGDHQHVTLFNFGDDVSLPSLSKIMESTYKVMEKFKPFSLSVNQISSFPPHPEKGTVPIICPVESKELFSLQKKLKAAYDRDGVEYSNLFPEYKPHTTLSYLDEEPEDSDYERKLPSAIRWGAQQVVLWGGDKGDSRLSVNFPLATKVNTASRVANRYKIAKVL